MIRTVNKEFATFLTQAGAALMGEVLRGEATISFDKCQVGSGLWAVTRNDNAGEIDFTVDVPEQLVNPLDNGSFDIDALTVSSSGVTEARANVPPSFGPATITEVAWVLTDGTVYAVTRYAPLPVMPPESGNSSEVSLRAFLTVGDVDAVTLIVESGITASRQFVEEEVAKVDAKTTVETEKLSQQLGELPISYLVTDPVLTGDLEQSYGNNISLAVSGGVSAWHNTEAAATIDHYEFVLPDESAVNGPNLTWPIPNDPALVDTEYQFKVRAIDTVGNFSAWVERTVTVVGNRRPNVDGFAHTVPSVAIKNQVVSVSFAGATDPDGDDSQMTYRITNPINVVESKTDDIVAGVLLNLTFADVAQNSSAGLTVVAIDQAGIQSAPQVITVDLRKLAVVVEPSGLAPAANAIDIDQQPYLSSTPFITNPVAFDTHKSTHIQVSTSAVFGSDAVVADMTVGALTSIRVTQQLAAGLKYFWRVRYEGNALGWADWSNNMEFTTTAITLGAVLPDGGIIGPQVDGYWLVVAPASARNAWMKFGLSTINTVLPDVAPTVIDPNSGLYNTDVLVAAYGAAALAAAFCRAMGNDWFLPNKEELQAIMAIKTQIDDADGSTGHRLSDIGGSGSKGAWSSTKSGQFGGHQVDASAAIGFNSSRVNNYSVIPVRRIPV
jgi:hypothetical protein